MESLRDRIAWLRRMPRHWKILLSSQLVFTLFAIQSRRKLIAKRQQELTLAEEETDAKPNPNDNNKKRETTSRRP